MKQINLITSKPRVKLTILMDSSALYVTMVELITRTCLAVPRLELKYLVVTTSKMLSMKQMFSNLMYLLPVPSLLNQNIERVLSLILRRESKN